MYKKFYDSGPFNCLKDVVVGSSIYHLSLNKVLTKQVSSGFLEQVRFGRHFFHFIIIASCSSNIYPLRCMKKDLFFSSSVMKEKIRCIGGDVFSSRNLRRGLLRGMVPFKFNEILHKVHTCTR